MKRIIKKASVTGAAILGSACMVAGGAAGIASADSISTTGPHSHNRIVRHATVRHSVHNRNNVDVNNHNSQYARTGDADVNCNTRGGSAHTGDAKNWNDTSTNVDIRNGGSGGATLASYGGGHGGGNDSIHLTGPGSNNTISSRYTNTSTVTNNNDVNVNNSNHQTAVSGDANVRGNTIGGSASTGDAVNSNSTSTDVSISN